MRMSTVQIFNQGVNNLLDRQADVTKTQEQLASGKRIMDASEDPAGTARVLNITSDLTRIDSYQRNTDNLQSQLAMEEGALRSVLRDLQRVRELTVQGNNAAMSAADRRSVGAEISGILTRWLTQPTRRMRRVNTFLLAFRLTFNHSPEPLPVLLTVVMMVIVFCR